MSDYNDVRSTAEIIAQLRCEGRTHIPCIARIETLERELTALRERHSHAERVAQLTAHRACLGVEHDPASGKIHGYCVVCGVPWPCNTATASGGKDV